jgi:hypothetical protein
MIRVILSLCICFVALMLASCAGEGRAARVPVIAQRYEYKVVRMDENAEQELTGTLNANAAEGWEYVGQVSGKGEHLVFKRPVNEGAMGGPMRGAGTRTSTGVGGRATKGP